MSEASIAALNAARRHALAEARLHTQRGVDAIETAEKANDAAKQCRRDADNFAESIIKLGGKVEVDTP